MQFRKMIPNAFTLGNLYCGFLSVGYAVNGHITDAAVFILIGMMLDAMDGRLARILRVESPLGLQLDSLADIVTFGVAPSFLVYYTTFDVYGTLGLFIAGLFPLFGAYRLARFNVTPPSTSKKYFTGIPITAAGGILALVTLMRSFVPEIVVIILFVVLAFFMVSTIRIPSFKDIPLPKYGTIVTLFLGYVLYVFWSSQRDSETTPLYLYVAIFIYVLYILNQFVYKKWLAKRRAEGRPFRPIRRRVTPGKKKRKHVNDHEE